MALRLGATSLGLVAMLTVVAVTTHRAGDDTGARDLVVGGGVPRQGSIPSAVPRLGGSGDRGTGATPAPGTYAAWAAEIWSATGVPVRALEAYALTQQEVADEQPECHLSWATLAGIGYIESGNGQVGGGLLASGRPLVPIVGVPLSGSGHVAAVPDSDDGRYDGDSSVDHAVGPLQFLPSSWQTWGADGDQNAIKDPQDIDDAALAAARYLCAAGDLATAAGWTTAVLSYNQSTDYLAAVRTATNTIAAQSLLASPSHG